MSPGITLLYIRSIYGGNFSHAVAYYVSIIHITYTSNIVVHISISSDVNHSCFLYVPIDVYSKVSEVF